MSSAAQSRWYLRLTVSITGRVCLIAWFATCAACSHVAASAAADRGTSVAARRLEEWRRGRIPLLMDDFGELAHYRKANASLKPPGPGEERVVFFGDSITAAWRLEESFPGKPYVNRGIGGQTTPQLLLRFHQDVVALQPRVVVILAGTNDIAGNTGPMSLEDSEANFGAMAELARAHGIAVVFCSVLPVHHYTPQSELTFPLRPPEQIVELNRWLKSAAAASGDVYLDYFSAVADDKGLLKRELAHDGLHPNKQGYDIMAKLAAAAVEQALSTARSKQAAPP